MRATPIKVSTVPIKRKELKIRTFDASSRILFRAESSLPDTYASDISQPSQAFPFDISLVASANCTLLQLQNGAASRGQLIRPSLALVTTRVSSRLTPMKIVVVSVSLTVLIGKLLFASMLSGPRPRPSRRRPGSYSTHRPTRSSAVSKNVRYLLSFIRVVFRMKRIHPSSEIACAHSSVKSTSSPCGTASRRSFR